jgi:hypothetical protein
MSEPENLPPAQQDADEVASAASDDDNEYEYERATLYLRPAVKEQYDNWGSLLKLNMYPVDSSLVGKKQCKVRELHEAIISVAMNHPDELMESLELRHHEPERFTEHVKNLVEL